MNTVILVVVSLLVASSLVSASTVLDEEDCPPCEEITTDCETTMDGYNCGCQVCKADVGESCGGWWIPCKTGLECDDNLIGNCMKPLPKVTTSSTPTSSSTTTTSTTPTTTTAAKKSSSKPGRRRRR